MRKQNRKDIILDSHIDRSQIKFRNSILFCIWILNDSKGLFFYSKENDLQKIVSHSILRKYIQQLDTKAWIKGETRPSLYEAKEMRATREIWTSKRLETWSDHRTSRSTERDTGAICLESDHEYAAVIRLLIMQQIYILRHYKKQEMKII